MGGGGHGYRSGTRHMFTRAFRKRGTIQPAKYLKTFKRGDIVEIVANSSIQKGMPHKFYHGRTGIVYNVTRRALGVEVNKTIRNRVIIKRVNVRQEHCRHSKCRQEFLDRVQRNDAIKRAAKEKGEKAPLESIKRFPVAPKAGYVVAADSAHGTPVLVAPTPFDEML